MQRGEQLNILQAVILGIVQGLAEFLPVSSSGHLVLLQKVFGITEPTMTFDVILHVGTLIPIVIVFRKDLMALIKKPFQKMTYLLAIGTLPAVLVSLLFGDFIDNMFQTGALLSLGFIITGVLLLWADSIIEGEKQGRDITYTDAVFIGCMQAIAITPAISRSGSTIAGSLCCKLKRETAAKFSFLLSIPAILGAVVLQLKDLATGEAAIGDISLLAVLFGFFAAMLSGYLSIRFMLKLIKECKLKYFSFYVFGLAAFIAFDQFITGIFF